MKKITIAAIILCGTSTAHFAQTNRINHFSHSGTSATLSIFEAADNMGCGEVLRGEYEPDTTLKIKAIKPDSTKTIPKNTISIPQSEKPRKGMSLESNMNNRTILKNANK